MDDLESDIEARACSLAKYRGWLPIKLTSMGSKGWPDRLFIRQGQVVFIEFKQPGKQPTKLQRYRMEELIQHGARAFWCDTVKKALDILEKHECES